MRGALNSSVIFSLIVEGNRLSQPVPTFNRFRENTILRASLYVWHLQCGALCDGLVTFEMCAGVKYCFFDEAVPQ